MLDQKVCSFAGLIVFLGGCFLIGVLGLIFTPRLIAYRLANLKQRKLEKFAPFFESTLRILFTLLVILSSYVLLKMPQLYRCVFK